MRIILCLLYIFFISATGVRASEGITGQHGTVIDGDTFFVCDKNVCTRIRLCGIDAPERGKPNYNRSKNALATIVKDKVVSCVFVGSGTVCDGLSKKKSRNRIVAQCFVGGTDIAAELVRNSHVCDWPKFSGGHYGDIQGACSRQ